MVPRMTQTDGILRVECQSELCVMDVAQARDEILPLLPGCTGIMLELADIAECDTAGIQFLLMLRASAQAASIPLSASPLSLCFQDAIDRAGIPAFCFNPLPAAAP
jgi:ABC-type transporter Mla MlaB component